MKKKTPMYTILPGYRTCTLPSTFFFLQLLHLLLLPRRPFLVPTQARVTNMTDSQGESFTNIQRYHIVMCPANARQAAIPCMQSCNKNTIRVPTCCRATRAEKDGPIRHGQSTTSPYHAGHDATCCHIRCRLQASSCPSVRACWTQAWLGGWSACWARRRRVVRFRGKTCC